VFVDSVGNAAEIAKLLRSNRLDVVLRSDLMVNMFDYLLCGWMSKRICQGTILTTRGHAD